MIRHCWLSVIFIVLVFTLNVADISAQNTGYAGYRERLRALKDKAEVNMQPPRITDKGNPCSTETKEGGTHYHRVSTQKSIESTLSDFIVFNPNRDVLWPGALIRWSSVKAGNLALINVPRMPVEVWLDVTHGTTPITKTNIAPRAPAVVQAINELLAANNKGFAAGIDFQYSEVHSLEQALLEIGVAAEWLTGSVAGAITQRKTSSSHVVLVRFTQIYYTVSYQLPTEGNYAVLSPNLDDGTLNDALDSEDPPMYISQINYGRTLLFRLESTYTFKEIQQALRVIQDFAAAKVDATAAEQALNTIAATEFKLLVKGGDPSAAISVISSKDFLKFIKEGATPSSTSPGVPVSFTLKQLRDNKTIALKRAGDFEVVDYSKQKRQVRVVVERIHVHNDGDSGFEGAGDFTWNFWLNGEAFGTQNEEVQISSGTGLNMSLTKVLDLDVTDTQEVLFKGEIIERDGLASGGDDRLPPLTQSYLLYNLTGTSIGFRRLNEGADPDVAVAWKVEILGGVQPPQPPCPGSRSGRTTNNDRIALSERRISPNLSQSPYTTCEEETWIGTAPICEGRPDDCISRQMTFMRSDPTGNGNRCIIGKKVLCQCDPTKRNRPFYLIAHRTNTVDKARQAVEAGANGLELDVRFQPERQRFCVNHDTTAFCDRETLDLYFAGLRPLISENRDQLALLIFDFKSAGGDPTAGRKLLEAVREFVAGTNLNVIVSVARWENRDWLRGMGTLHSREALAIDEDDDPVRVAEFFRRIEVKNHAYGNGSCVVCTEPPEKAFDAALELRAEGSNRFVYVWTLRNEESMRRFISKGVDGIMVNDIAALGRALCSTCVAYLAKRDHNPFHN